jgi:hypothetical protein
LCKGWADDFQMPHHRQAVNRWLQAKRPPINMKFLLTISILFTALNIFGQTADNTNRFDEKNIYYQALTQYLNYLKSIGDKVPDTLYVEDDFGLTDSLLLQSGQTTFIKLTYDDRIQMFNKKNSFILYRLFPLKFDKGIFSVSFVPFIVTKQKRKRNLYYSNPGSYKVVFKFDNNGQFNFVKVENYGI